MRSCWNAVMASVRRLLVPIQWARLWRARRASGESGPNSNAVGDQLLERSDGLVDVAALTK
jgi:hypothetical protein